MDEPEPFVQRRRAIATGRIRLRKSRTSIAHRAREFLGLPDLRPLQAAGLAQVEKRLIADVQKFSPERIARSVLPGAGPERLRSTFGALAGQARPTEKDKELSG